MRSLLTLHSLLLASWQSIKQLFSRWTADPPADPPDFSTLPRLPWIRVLSYLNIEERYAASQTCETLQDICLTENRLWRSIVVFLGHSGFGKPTQKELTAAEKAMLTRDVCGVQRVLFVLRPFLLSWVREETLAAITRSSRRWRLKTLEIHGPTRSLDEARLHQIEFGICSPDDTSPEVELFLSDYLTSAATNTLEVLNIYEWRWCDQMKMPTILRILRRVRFTHSLRQLKLGLIGLTDSKYYLKHDSSCSVFCDVVTMFINLQTLNVPSVFVNDHFLLALSQTRHVPLEKLVIEGAHFGGRIQPSNWSQLLASSPALEVHLRIFNGPGFECSDVTGALPPFVPVTQLQLTSTHHRSPLDCKEQYETLTYVVPWFSKHLEALSYSERHCWKQLFGDPGPPLLEAVTQCSKLTQLSFDGNVHSDTILHLAALSRKWTVFEFFFDSICPSHAALTSQQLCSQVSKHLQRPWRWSKSYWENMESVQWQVRYKKQTLRVRMLDPTVTI